MAEQEMLVVEQCDRDLRSVILQYLVEHLGKPCAVGDMPDDRNGELDNIIARHRLATTAPLHARIDELERALKPFAEFADWLTTRGDRWQDPAEEFQVGDFAYTFSVAWVQAASRALSEGLAATKAADERVRVLEEALRIFIGAAYPVATAINTRGYNWSEAYLDQALPIARAALATPEGEI